MSLYEITRVCLPFFTLELEGAKPQEKGQGIGSKLLTNSVRNTEWSQ